MNVLLVTIFVIFAISVYLMVKKEVPLLVKRKRAEWEAELKKAEVKRKHEDKQDLEIKEAVKIEKKELFINNRQERARQHYKDTKRKGNEYELYITEYFENLGYKTKPFGILNGRKDKGIDVIIMKDKVITLIQCKDWKADGKYKIQHNHLKEFLGNTTAFLENKKKEAEGYTIKRMYVTSNDILDSSAKNFLKENRILEHRTIPIERDK